MKIQSPILEIVLYKVRHVVTDHASNMLKAFHLPGYEGDGDSSDDEEKMETIIVLLIILPVQHTCMMFFQ